LAVESILTSFRRRHHGAGVFHQRQPLIVEFEACGSRFVFADIPAVDINYFAMSTMDESAILASGLK
jgi:hypothetical protein